MMLRDDTIETKLSLNLITRVYENIKKFFSVAGEKQISRCLDNIYYQS